MESTFDGLVSRLHMTKENICELEDMPIHFFELNEKRKKNEQNGTEYTRADNYERCEEHVMGMLEGKRKKGENSVLMEPSEITL